MLLDPDDNQQFWDYDALRMEQERRAGEFAQHIDGLAARGERIGQLMIARYGLPGMSGTGTLDAATIGTQLHFARVTLPPIFSRGDDGLRRRVRVTREYICSYNPYDSSEDELPGDYLNDLPEEPEAEYQSLEQLEEEDEALSQTEAGELGAERFAPIDLISANTSARVERQVAPDEALYVVEGSLSDLPPLARLGHEFAIQYAYDVAGEQIMPADLADQFLEAPEYEWLLRTCGLRRTPIGLPGDVSVWPLPGSR